VPPEAEVIEVEKVFRRIDEMAEEAKGKQAKAQKAYQVLGPAPAGERCLLCGKSGRALRIRHGGQVDVLHEPCVVRHIAALADPPVKIPEQPPLDEHNVPRRKARGKAARAGNQRSPRGRKAAARRK
jgi:hypothetical protein